ncbi:MAG: LptF/LptG family permease [Elusimicrobiota bacterium]|jgi:lipopolysaccharide export system permease protein|nr:LptF/LptG family permease [Elusimicrobiota bacterium]
MKIISKYIARKFWGPFFFIFCIFAALIFLADSIEKLRWTSTYSVSLWSVLKYTLMTMPDFLMQVLPAVCLLSALLVISDMIAAGEWTACLAGGFTVRQIFKPLIACIVLVAAFGFLAQAFFVPFLSLRSEVFYEREIKRNKDWSFNVENDVTLRLDGRRVLFAKILRPEAGQMEGMFIDSYDEGWALASQISARNFRWDAARRAWVFEDGVIRRFGKNATLEETPFNTLLSDYAVPPQDISVGGMEGALLSVPALIKRIEFLETSGLSAYKEHTLLHTRLAAPFAAVIMCLLGMPLAIALKRSSKILNIVCAVAIGFGFWWIVSILSSAGQSGMLNPALAGWLPVAVFAAVAWAEFKILKI